MSDIAYKVNLLNYETIIFITCSMQYADSCNG